MSPRIETLEARSLFSATLPVNIAAAYQAVLNDNATLRQDLHNENLALRTDKTALVADVKAMGKSKSNALLLRSAESAGVHLVTALTADTARYLPRAAVDARRLALAEAALTQNPSAAAQRRFIAADHALTALQAGPLAKLHAEADTGDTALVAALQALLNANPAAPKLDTDLRADNTQQNDLGNTQTLDTEQAGTDLDALLTSASRV